MVSVSLLVYALLIVAFIALFTPMLVQMLSRQQTGGKEQSSRKWNPVWVGVGLVVFFIGVYWVATILIAPESIPLTDQFITFLNNLSPFPTAQAATVGVEQILNTDFFAKLQENSPLAKIGWLTLGSALPIGAVLMTNQVGWAFPQVRDIYGIDLNTVLAQDHERKFLTFLNGKYGTPFFWGNGEPVPPAGTYEVIGPEAVARELRSLHLINMPAAFQNGLFVQLVKKHEPDAGAWLGPIFAVQRAQFMPTVGADDICKLRRYIYIRYTCPQGEKMDEFPWKESAYEFDGPHLLETSPGWEDVISRLAKDEKSAIVEIKELADKWKLPNFVLENLELFSRIVNNIFATGHDIFGHGIINEAIWFNYLWNEANSKEPEAFLTKINKTQSELTDSEQYKYQKLVKKRQRSYDWFRNTAMATLNSEDRTTEKIAGRMKVLGTMLFKLGELADAKPGIFNLRATFKTLAYAKEHPEADIQTLYLFRLGELLPDIFEYYRTWRLGRDRSIILGNKKQNLDSDPSDTNLQLSYKNTVEFFKGFDMNEGLILRLLPKDEVLSDEIISYLNLFINAVTHRREYGSGEAFSYTLNAIRTHRMFQISETEVFAFQTPTGGYSNENLRPRMIGEFLTGHGNNSTDAFVGITEEINNEIVNDLLPVEISREELNKPDALVEEDFLDSGPDTEGDPLNEESLPLAIILREQQLYQSQKIQKLSSLFQSVV